MIEFIIMMVCVYVAICMYNYVDISWLFDWSYCHIQSQL